MAKRGITSTAQEKRHTRVRAKMSKTHARPRLCVSRSLKHTYAQVIDDTQSHTLAAASTLDPKIRAEAQGKTKKQAAELVGSLIAERAIRVGVTQVVFDRGKRKYHGRVKVLAEAARGAGLDF